MTAALNENKLSQNNIGICSQEGPATLQYNTARVGGELMKLLSAETHRECADACCRSYPCRSWVLAKNICELRSGYSGPVSNVSASV